jgi:hypothetical protein
MRVPNAIILAVLAGHLAALGLQHELWPFSPYPMYADPRTERTYRMLRPVGVDADGREVALDRLDQIAPFNPYGLSESLRRLTPDQRPKALLALLRRHPELVKMRLYEFDLEPHPESGGRAKIVRRTLIDEAP